MHRFGCLILTCFLLLGGFPATPQEAVQSPAEIGPSGDAYLNAINRSGIDPNVAYYDPTAAVPPLETAQQPEPEPDRSDPSGINGNNIRWPSAIVAALIIAGIIYLFARFGGGFLVALNPDADNPHLNIRQGRRNAKKPSDAPPRSLKEILSMADRRDALVALAQNALRVAVTANGLLLQQSWTSRDALRRLPADQSHLAALRNLVRASERVQFGGRDVTEPEFKGHVEQISPLFRELSR